MGDLKPRAAIRRFDVFAEYNRLKAMDKDGLSPAKAKGYGLWVAKVVAARKFGRMPEDKAKDKLKEEGKPAEFDNRSWHVLSGVPQTARLFDHEIVDRMGKEFYQEVFVPALHKAYAEGKDYREIRDSIRAAWKPKP